MSWSTQVSPRVKSRAEVEVDFQGQTEDVFKDEQFNKSILGRVENDLEAEGWGQEEVQIYSSHKDCEEAENSSNIEELE